MRKPTDPKQAVSERTPFMFALLRKLGREDSVPYVFDSTLFSAENVRKQQDLPKFCIPVFLGYPDANADQKFRQIKTHADDHNCVFSELSDSELRNCIQTWISESINLREKCMRYEYLFVDTTHGLDAALHEAVQRIEQEHPNNQSDSSVALGQ